MAPIQQSPAVAVPASRPLADPPALMLNSDASVPEYTPVRPCTPIGLAPEYRTGAPLTPNEPTYPDASAPTEPGSYIHPPQSDPPVQPQASLVLPHRPSCAPIALEVDPQPPSAIAHARQGKTEKKYLRSGKMQPGDSVTARLVKWPRILFVLPTI
ncbi:hypothetical protein BC826DRAFT_1021316 [Russula brevipes]|nr:hypothetical protein BC826DRAFT_1021316 [Russula brevipes]